jgi:hypothetical protein
MDYSVSPLLRVIAHVVPDGQAHPDYTLPADSYPFPDYRTTTDERTLTYGDITVQDCSS